MIEGWEGRSGKKICWGIRGCDWSARLPPVSPARGRQQAALGARARATARTRARAIKQHLVLLPLGDVHHNKDHTGERERRYLGRLREYSRRIALPPAHPTSRHPPIRLPRKESRRGSPSIPPPPQSFLVLVKKHPSRGNAPRPSHQSLHTVRNLTHPSPVNRVCPLCSECQGALLFSLPFHPASFCLFPSSSPLSLLFTLAADRPPAATTHHSSTCIQLRRCPSYSFQRIRTLSVCPTPPPRRTHSPHALVCFLTVPPTTQQQY